MDSKERKLIGIVIVGTLRNWKKRRVNILKVAEALKSLHTLYGSLDKVSKSVKLSSEMIREFLKLLELTDQVKNLIQKGLINSVDIGYRISKLHKKDQIVLAKNVVNKNLRSNDIRNIVRYKLDNPSIKINEVMRRVLESKDKKYFVAYLGIEEHTFEELKLKLISKNEIENSKFILDIFNKVIKKEHIVSFTLNGRVIIIKVTREGLDAMREKTKELRIPLSNLGDALVKEYLDNKLKIAKRTK